MAGQLSKALRKAAASGVGYRAALNADPATHTAVLIEYSGAIPANADASIGDAVALCAYTNASAGLSLDEAVDTAGQIVMSINAGETWTGTTIGAGGTPTFWRMTEAADVPTDATGTYCRLQGTSGIGGSFDHTVSGAYAFGASNTWLAFTFTVATY